MSDANSQQQGSLERLGIPLETLPGEGVLTPGTVKAVRFRMSKPTGYAVKDVEDFVLDIVQPSLTWYSQALHQRDLAIHTLGEELDRAEVDLLNLRFQLQTTQYSARVEEGVALNQDDKEMAALLVQLTTLQESFNLSNQKTEELTAYAQAQDEYIDQILVQLQNVTSATEEKSSEPAPRLAVSTEVEENPVYPTVAVKSQEVSDDEIKLETVVVPPVEVKPVYEPELEEIKVEEVEIAPTPAPSDNVLPIYGVLPKGLRPEDL